MPCQPELVGDTDYRTAYMGKWHLGDEIWSQHGFENWEAIEDSYINHYSEGRDRSEKSAYHHFLVENGFGTDAVSRGQKIFSRDFAARLPLEFTKATFLRDRARHFIRRYRDEPFLLHVNFLEPHHPNFGPFNGLHPEDEIALSPNWNAHPGKDVPRRYYYKRFYYAKRRGIEEADVRRETSRYWGLVTQVDMAVGGILRELQRWGLEENTIVIYTSDHGDMMGCHGLYQKGVMYEESARVPCTIRFPRGGFSAGRIEHPISHIDLVPTVLDLLGVGERGEGLPGKSLRRYLDASVRPEPVFQQWHAYRSTGLIQRIADLGVGSPEDVQRAMAEVNSRAVISPEGYKLSLSDNDVTEFYDLNKDPYEMENAYSDRRYRETIANLTAALEPWQDSIEDTISVRLS